jgi:tetratricopeptide (TPR) repeat protein
MFESWVSKRKSPHLQKALLLRKAGKFKEALEFLNYACDIGQDGEAFYFKADAYVTGGFYLEADRDLAREYFKKAELAGCTWPADYQYGKIPITEDGHILKYVNNPILSDKLQSLEYSAESGDAYAQNKLSKCGDEYTKLACYQKNTDAIDHAYETISIPNYCSCEFDLLKLADIFVETGHIDGIRKRIALFSDRKLKNEEAYIYGKNIDKFNQNWFNTSHYEYIRSVYFTSWTNTQKAVIFWMMWTKRDRILCPDLRRLIGKIIWESRSKPQIWGDAKKKKKKIKI